VTARLAPTVTPEKIRIAGTAVMLPDLQRNVRNGSEAAISAPSFGAESDPSLRLGKLIGSP
jgi:hypothetical protein